MSNNKGPIDRIPYGNLQASIWENQGDKGAFYNVTFSRSYQVDGEWKNTNSFNERDVQLLAKLAVDAGVRMRELSQGQTQVEEPAQKQELQQEVT